MGVIEGVDYSFSHPTPASLKAAGKKFAVRYVGPGYGKLLSASELAALRNAGVDVVANAEGAENGFKWASAGQDWARQALADMRDLGAPAGRPVYFSVDWDARDPDFPAIDAALRGAAAVLGGVERVGVYGGYRVIEHCHDAGTATWFWQTYGWSTFNGSIKWHPACHLQQYRNGVNFGGGNVDFTRAMQADYGQWGYQGETVDEQSIITALYNDLSRNPGTKDPNGQSGLNKLFRQFASEETAKQLVPVIALVKSLASQEGVDTAALQAAVAQVDEEVLAKLTAAGRSPQDIAAALRAALGDDGVTALAHAILGQ